MANGQQVAPAGSCYQTGGSNLKEQLSDGQLLEQFVKYRDEHAFSALLRRHAPMVLGVCRRVLRHAQDAEDAFQATFVVLVHKARTLAQPNLLASWLHGVAYRTAQHARVRAARRCRHEREAASMFAASSDPETTWQDMRDRLDEELQRLPEFYRAPLVLCYLEGKTNIEAAQILGWPPGSMSARLARARELLHERLTDRRRRALGAFFLPFVLTYQLEGVSVPPALIESTSRMAMGLGAAGKGLAPGLVSSAVRELAEASLQAASVSRRPWRPALVASLIVAALLGLSAAAYALTDGGWPLASTKSTAVSAHQNGQDGACGEKRGQ